MDANDAFQAKRAAEARAWLSDPARVAEDRADRAKRAAADKAAGHSTRCSLSRCAADCPQTKRRRAAKDLVHRYADCPRLASVPLKYRKVTGQADPSVDCPDCLK